MSDDAHDARVAWMRSALGRYEQPLVRYATRLVDGDKERAREVVQETFLRLWKADQKQVEGHLAEWLYTVCRNRAVDIRRREDRMQNMTFDEAEARPSPAPNPADRLERQQSLSHALQALSKLPDNQQEVIRLKFQGGLSYKEISRVTGHSISNVGYLIHSGMKALRGVLQDAETSTPVPRRTP